MLIVTSKTIYDARYLDTNPIQLKKLEYNMKRFKVMIVYQKNPNSIQMLASTI